MASTALALAMILASSLLAWEHSQQQARSAAQVLDAQRMLAALNQIETTMTDAETGQRGYLLTGDEVFLEPYHAATGTGQVPVIYRPPIGVLLESVERMDRGANRELLNQVRTLVNDKLAVIDRTIALRRAGRSAEANAVVREGRGKRFMDALRATLSGMRTRQRDQIKQAEVQRQQAANRALLSAGVTGMLSVLSIALLVGSTRLASRHLRNSEARFRSLVEATASVVWRANARGAMLEENLSWEAFTGQERRHYQDHHWLTAVHRADRRALVQTLRTAARAGAYWEAQLRLQRRDGAWRDMVVRGVPLFDDKGNVCEWVGTCSDVTDLLRTENRLRRQQEEFHMLAENMGQHAWMIDGNGHFLWFNRRWYEYTGLDRNLPFDEQWRRATAHPEHRERIEACLQSALATGSPWEDTIALRGVDDSYQWFLVSVLPIRAEDGKLSWFGTATNIDERLRLEQELKDSNRRKDEFIATLAHELRNPLAPVLAGVELMKMSANLPPQLVRTRAIMDRQLNHLVRIIDDLLDVARISTGRLALRTAPVAMKTVIDSALEVSRLHIDASHHELDIALPAEQLVVEGDLVRLAQVVGILLSNAAKYTPDGGMIRLILERDGAEAVLQVIDNGIGIPADMLPHVFDLFAQAHNSRGQRKGGVGIGLAIARQLVQLHGGRIEAASEGPGRGSRFTVRLPLARVETAQTAPPLAQAEDPGGRRRVMILDDNVDAAETLGELIGLAGHEVRLAHTGHDAIALARDWAPEIALLDIGLPDISGYEVARALRQLPQLQSACLVALTGWGAPQDRQQSREAGFDHHLTKPVTLDALGTAVPQLRLQASLNQTH